MLYLSENINWCYVYGLFNTITHKDRRRSNATVLPYRGRGPVSMLQLFDLQQVIRVCDEFPMFTHCYAVCQSASIELMPVKHCTWLQ